MEGMPKVCGKERHRKPDSCRRNVAKKGQASKIYSNNASNEAKKYLQFLLYVNIGLQYP
jgi:hypothetical protein